MIVIYFSIVILLAIILDDENMQPQMSITNELKNDIYVNKSEPSDTPQPFNLCASVQSSDRVSTHHENSMRKSVSIPSNLARSVSSLNSDLKLSNSLSKVFQQQPFVLNTYQIHLKCTYQALSILSKQGWIDSSNMKDQFINVTIIKSMQRIGQSTEYTTNTQEILNHQIQYSSEVYKIYNTLFETIDSTKRQLVLLEGNAGTGKTTLAYKVCKEWAEGNLLSQYSHVILLQLRDLKPGKINKPEQIFDTMGKLNKKAIYAEMVAKFGSGVLFWLEGWDELENSLRFQSILTDLLSGKVLPLATIVISTRPSATGSLKEFFNSFTYNFKLVGFTYKQIEEYVNYYCQTELNSNLAKKFLM